MVVLGGRGSAGGRQATYVSVGDSQIHHDVAVFVLVTTCDVALES